MKKYLWLIFLLPLLAACQPGPEFINHPPPDLSVNFDVFEDAGCPKDEYGSRFCERNSAIASLGCEQIGEPSNLLGGLEPSYPIAVCPVHLMSDQVPAETRAEIEQGLYFFGTGGMLNTYVRYVIYQDGEFHVIRSEQEFRDIYAPIESPEEALSYGLAVRKLAAYYGLENDPLYTYTVDTIEDTYVTSETDGYSLHLYYYELFGCGPHWTSTVEVHISFEGIVEEISRAQVFRNPNDDGLCVD